MDTKCKYGNDSKCWYCNELCEICFKPTVLGPSCTDSTNRLLQFCSEECHDFYNQKPEPQSKVFSPDDQDNPERRVLVGHKEYLHLSSCGKLDDGSAGFIMSASLCEGDGSETFPIQQYYLNYHLRTPQYQCYYELLISDNLEALDSVSYTGATCNLFKQGDENAIKQKVLGIVSNIIREFGGLGVSDFLEKVRLYNLMGASCMICSKDSDRKDESATAHGEVSVQGSYKKEESGQVAKGLDTADKLVISPHQLLALLEQCGGDHKKVAGMIQDLMASNSGNQHGLEPCVSEPGEKEKEVIKSLLKNKDQTKKE